MRTNTCRLGAMILIPILGCFFLNGCLDFKSPLEKDDIAYSKASIMPNRTRFLHAQMGADIEGAWFWYKNVGSTIERVDAYWHPSATEDAQALKWYNDEDNVTAQIDNEDITAVDEICFQGKLSRSPSDDSSMYAGIGFNLCSSFPGEDPLTHLPLPVGKCRIGGREHLLRTFLGISFRIGFPDGLPEESRLIVQFRERAHNVNSRNPECVVIDTVNDSDVTEEGWCTRLKEEKNAYEIEAWHGRARRRGSDGNIESTNENAETEMGTDPRNLAALMTIQFELLSDIETDFRFCLSDLKEIFAQNPRDDISFTNPNLGEEYVNTNIPKDRNCLSRITETASGSDDFWVYAKKEMDDSDTDSGGFWIMKKEVTAEQYSRCVDADESDGCSEPREWETCSTFKYRDLKEKYESLSDADNDKLDKLEAELNDAANIAANCVNWYDADKFCKWIGGQLPTKSQWEYAARSGGRKMWDDYPWSYWDEAENNDSDTGGADDDEIDGISPDCDKAVISGDQGPGCGEKYLPVEGCTKSDSKDYDYRGACDLIGNLWEWVEEAYLDIDDPQTEYWKPEDEEWVRGKTSQLEYRTIKGGGFDDWNTVKDDWELLSISGSTSMEHPIEPHKPNNVGFRCIIFGDPDAACNDGEDGEDKDK